MHPFYIRGGRLSCSNLSTRDDIVELCMRMRFEYLYNVCIIYYIMYNSTIAILYNVYKRHSDEKTRLRISTSLTVLYVLINVTIIALRFVVVAELTNLLNKTNKSYPDNLFGPHAS